MADGLTGRRPSGPDGNRSVGLSVHTSGLSRRSPEVVLSFQNPLVPLIEGFDVLVVEALLFELIQHMTIC